MGILANIAGFLFLPIAGGVAYAVADSVLKPKSASNSFLLATACHSVSGFAMYKMAENARGTSHDLLRGGMWGEALSAGGFAAQTIYERTKGKEALPIGVTASLPPGSKVPMTLLGQFVLAAQKKGH